EWKALDAYCACSSVGRVRVTRHACRRVPTLSVPSVDALERLWARSMAGADTSERVAAGAERVGAGLCNGLTRWIGSEGYQGLLLRALGEVRTAHPWMAALR